MQPKLLMRDDSLSQPQVDQIFPIDWIVSQLSAREHYAVPRAFAAANRLKCFYTDVWMKRGRGLVSRGPTSVRALAGRFHEAIDSRHVVSFTPPAIAKHLRCSLMTRPRSIEEIFTWDVEYGTWFDRRVSKHLGRQKFDAAVTGFFGFLTGCLQSLKVMRDRGVFSIVDQASAGRAEEILTQEEVKRWPGWSDAPQAVPEVYYDRLRAEWNAADAILVNSNWSKRAITQDGVPAEKVMVVPCVFEPEAAAPPPRRFNRKPLRVLYLGRVSLAKGVQYLIEAAEFLKNEPIEFEIVGPMRLTERATAHAPPNLHFRGRVTREQTSRFYRDADLFVFPTLSDGFGMTQLEAMSQGLPVIATPNCGEVVIDGENGLIIPIRDASAIAAAISRLERDRGLLASMSANALRRAAQFTIEHYRGQLDREITAMCCDAGNRS